MGVNVSFSQPCSDHDKETRKRKMSITADRIIAISTGKTIYKDGDSVIKVFCRPYTKLDVMKEAYNQALLEAAALSVPRVQEVFPADGGWAIRYEYARGKALSQLMEAAPAKAGEYMAQLVEIQRTIAAADAPLLPRLVDKLKRAILTGIQDTERRTELCAALDSMPDGRSTCRGALLPRDIIVNESGYCVLNWANAAHGNSFFDVADTYVQLMLEDDEKLPLSALYIDTFCADDAELERTVRQFVPICAAARMGSANERERGILNRLMQK